MSESDEAAAEGDARGAPRRRSDVASSSVERPVVPLIGTAANNPIELGLDSSSEEEEEEEELHHPGELEPAEDGFVDWDDACHGDRNSNRVKRENPDEYEWTCCGLRGSSAGCTTGEGWTLAERYMSSPEPNFPAGETRHPGDLEVNYESGTWDDWDENCHGKIDTKSNKSEYPDGFTWTCCGKEGTYASGCEEGSEEGDYDEYDSDK
jgi:hypothetical protein